MGTKNNPGQFDCYKEAADDEPMFVLLGRDEDAPELIEDWCRKRLAKLLASEMTPHELHRGVAKISEALVCANAMRSHRIALNAKTFPPLLDVEEMRAIIHGKPVYRDIRQRYSKQPGDPFGKADVDANEQAMKGWSTGLDGYGEKGWRGTGSGRGNIDDVQRARGFERNPDYHGRFPPPSDGGDRLDPEGGIPGRKL